MNVSHVTNGQIKPTTARLVIYQLLVRLFGNTNEARVLNGTMEQNGCGKFADISDVALAEIKGMGFNAVWLTGVLEQASGTEYPGRAADDVRILKGLAGSPYAIKDYFDVCPDYAVDPERRLVEFRELVERCHAHGLRVLMDFVPNHVARNYASDVMPEYDFGLEDKPTAFFDRDNHFYYLQMDQHGGGPPLKLPCSKGSMVASVYEKEAVHGRVTGNNAITWAPSVYDWYETVKLNYGHDFTKGNDTRHLPGVSAGVDEVPRTWATMDRVFAYWQGMGVDGFRVDMAHMIPMEFWRWVIHRARGRDSSAYFVAEAYDNDPSKLTPHHVLDELLRVGFNAVYDDPCYDVLEGIYDSGKWANDLDSLSFCGHRFHKSLRYAENHDEVRLANPGQWGGVGMMVGKPVSAVLFGMGRGPVMVYHGQEVGEPALEPLGFGGHHGRTSIFDYGSIPELAKWVNGGKFDGGRLSAQQKALRDWYRQLLQLLHEGAFANGEFYGLNYANRHHEAFGRVDGENHSGHWLYAYLRRDRRTSQAFLVVANFHPQKVMTDVRVLIPKDARMFVGRTGYKHWQFADRLESDYYHEMEQERLEDDGLWIPILPPCSAMYIEITVDLDRE